MQKYDVIIVGAGMAGLMAGKVLNDANINFLLIDSKKEIGLPLKCGEGTQTKYFLKLFRHLNYDFIKNRIDKHIVYYRDIESIVKWNIIILDRPKFEKWLAKPIEGKIRLNTVCTDVAIHKNYAEVITPKQRYRADLVILCYGCNFKLQKKFGLLKKDEETMFCYGGICTNHKLDNDKCYYFFGDDYRGYLFWVFPKNKDEANIGFGAIKLGKNNPKKIFKFLLERYNLNVKPKIEYAGIVPKSGPIEKTYSNRLLVCGNAAGHVRASNGEGIYFALEGGKLAAETALEACNIKKFDETFLKKYEIRWKKSFGKMMESGLIAQDLMKLIYKYDLIRIIKLPILSKLLISSKSLNKNFKRIINGNIPYWIRAICFIAKVLKLQKH